MIAESKFAIQTFAVKVLFVLLCNKKENNLYPLKHNLTSYVI